MNLITRYRRWRVRRRLYTEGMRYAGDGVDRQKQHLQELVSRLVSRHLDVVVDGAQWYVVPTFRGAQLFGEADYIGDRYAVALAWVLAHVTEGD